MTTTPNWWNLEGDNAAKSMCGLISTLNENLVSQHRANINHMRLYTNNSLADMTVSAYYLRAVSQRGQSYTRANRMNWNVIKSATDTLTSKIGKDKIRPSFLTSGAWAEQQSRAENLSDWLYGLFTNSGFYRRKRAVFKDGAVFGTGIGYVYSEKVKDKYQIKFERVFPDEILIDPYDGYYGEPRSIYRVKSVSRDYLRGIGVPESTVAALPCKTGYASGLKSTVIDICIGIHLPTNGNDGKMLIASNGRKIYEGEWKRQRFPYAAFKYIDDLLGFWGVGVAEDLTGDQIEINRLLNTIKTSQMLISLPRILVHTGSKVNPQHLTNAPGGIVPWSGNIPPQIVTSVGVGADTFQQLDRLWMRAFERVGLNQQTAGGRSPVAGTASGVAIREAVAVESERLADTQEAWEQWHCDIGQVMIDEAEELYEQGHDIEVSANSIEKGMWPLKYSDVRLPADSYMIHCFPRSALPKTPGARLAYVDEMVSKGYMDAEEGRELLNFPDLKANNMLAQRHNIRRILEKMLRQPKNQDGRYEYSPPEPYMNLPLAQKLGQDYYVAMLAELPEDSKDEQADKIARLDLLRKWIDSCSELQKPPVAEPGGNMGGMVPPGPEGEPVGPEMAPPELAGAMGQI